jgi:hypothetical protein
MPEPKYKHFCPDWDYAEIDETYPEFECCTCFHLTVNEREEAMAKGGKPKKQRKPVIDKKRDGSSNAPGAGVSEHKGGAVVNPAGAPGTGGGGGKGGFPGDGDGGKRGQPGKPGRAP